MSLPQSAHTGVLSYTAQPFCFRKALIVPVHSLVTLPTRLDCPRGQLVLGTDCRSIYSYINSSAFLFQDSVDRSCPLVGNILTAQITLPRTGFFLGDRLNVSGLITNTSSSSRKVKVGIKIVRVSSHNIESNDNI